MGLLERLIRALLELSDNRANAAGGAYELSETPESDELGWIDELEMIDALIEDDE